jgi:hypothetical protein
VIRLTHASPAHVGRLANRLRDIDRRECEAMGRTAKQALRMGLKASVHAISVVKEDDGRPIAMFGVMSTSIVSGSGVVWFLGTDDVFEFPRDLAWTGRAMIEHWLETEFRTLTNVVSVENEKAVRLLKYWGATVGDEVQVHRGIEFVPFTFKRPAIQGDGPPA